MSALWLIKVQTSKKQLQEVSMKPFIAVVSLCPCFIKACAMLPSACWWVWTPCCVCFSVVWEPQDAVRFSHHHFNGFRCLQESMCPTLPLIQRDTVRNLQKNDPNQTSRALQETKTIRDKHPNRPHMKVIVRPERRAEMQRELKGIRNKRWGGQPWSRVNFTEGPK